MAKASQSSTLRPKLPAPELPPLVVGMTVRLASGGPAMTVDSVDRYSIGCTWFQEVGANALGEAMYAGDLRSGQFARDSLEIID